MGGIHFFVEGSLHKYRSLFEEVCPAPMTIPKGQTLCTQCCTHGWLYYILDGLAKVYITTSDGNEQIIDFMMRDTLIGMDCIDDEKKSVVSIASVTEMAGCSPSLRKFLRRMILDNPQLGFDLVVYYGEVLRQVSFMVGSLGHADLMVRLASFFLLFIDTLDYQQNHKILLTQQEIASCINVSRRRLPKCTRSCEKKR